MLVRYDVFDQNVCTIINVKLITGLPQVIEIKVKCNLLVCKGIV